MTLFDKLYGKLGLITRIATVLAADPASRMKILLCGLWLCFNDVCRHTTQYGLTVRLKKFGETFNFRLEHYSDYSALSNIFIHDQYWMELPYTPQIIFDLGSNVGLSLLYFLLRYPEAQLFGFEPDTDNYRRLKRLADQLHNVHVYNLAVSSFDGYMKFYPGQRSHISSSVFHRKPHEKAVDVETKKLDTIIDELDIDRVDLLKFNIEGAELEVFRNFKRKSLVRTYVGQIHSDLFNGEGSDMIALFSDYEVQIRKERRPQRCQMVAIRKHVDSHWLRPETSG